jgi:hypothetical protein
MSKGFQRKPPKEPGTRIGNLTILEFLEYGDRGLAKKQQWYKVQCDCGTIEEANHVQLMKKWACKDCMFDKRGMSISLAKRKPLVPEGLPDFAKMKLRGF